MRQRVEHRQVERERLAARGAGGDDEVLPAPGRVPCLALVREERVEGQSVTNERVKVVGQRRRASVACRLSRHVRELVALQQVVPERSRCHALDRSNLATLRTPGCLAKQG